jgi:hypothetical protein
MLFRDVAVQPYILFTRIDLMSTNIVHRPVYHLLTSHVFIHIYIIINNNNNTTPSPHLRPPIVPLIQPLLPNPLRHPTRTQLLHNPPLAGLRRLANDSTTNAGLGRRLHQLDPLRPLALPTRSLQPPHQASVLPSTHARQRNKAPAPKAAGQMKSSTSARRSA